MVKTTAAFTIVVTVLLVGCASRRLVDVRPEALLVAAGSHGGTVSLASSGDTLVGVYSDRSTTTLDAFTLPIAPHLPSTLPAPQVIDTIDFAPPLASAFGQHVLSVAGGESAVLYDDREGTDKLVLKLASKPLDSAHWDLSVLEPPGSPVAVLPAAAGGFDAVWASGELLAESYSPPIETTVFSPFALFGQPSMAGNGGATAFDGLSQSLLVVKRDAAGYSARRVPGVGPIHASLLSPEGALSVLSWDGSSRRLILQQERVGRDVVSRVTVTLCDGTSNLALLPGPTPSTHLFVFDESRRFGGRDLYQLSLIAPAGAFSKAGQRYRKAILKTGVRPIEAFAAVRTPQALYVLVLQGELTLLRLDMPEDRTFSS